MLSFGLSYLLCNFVALLYPTYASFKALQTVAPEDDSQWLTYWVVYAVIQTFEGTLLWVLAWVPLYYEIKLVFILWLIMPQTKGAELLYEQVIKPNLVKYGSKINPIFGTAEKVLTNNQVAQVVKMAEKYGPGVATKAFEKAFAEAQKLAGQGADMLRNSAPPPS